MPTYIRCIFVLDFDDLFSGSGLVKHSYLGIKVQCGDEKKIYTEGVASGDDFPTTSSSLRAPPQET